MLPSCLYPPRHCRRPGPCRFGCWVNSGENLTSVALGLRYFVHTASPGAVIEVVKVVRTEHVLQRAGILTPGPTVRFAGSRCGGRSADDKPVAWGDIREARERTTRMRPRPPSIRTILIPGSRSGVRRRSRVPDPPDCAGTTPALSRGQRRTSTSTPRVSPSTAANGQVTRGWFGSRLVK